MGNQVSDPGIVVNNIAIPVVPNTVRYTEGFGEQEILVESAGGGILQQVFSNNVETNLSMIAFELRPTVANINFVRQWKAQGNQNVVAIQAQVPDGSLTRTFNNAALTNDPEVNLTADGTIAVEWKSDKATI